MGSSLANPLCPDSPGMCPTLVGNTGHLSGGRGGVTQTRPSRMGSSGHLVNPSLQDVPGLSQDVPHGILRTSSQPYFAGCPRTLPGCPSWDPLDIQSTPLCRMSQDYPRTSLMGSSLANPLCPDSPGMCPTLVGFRNPFVQRRREMANTVLTKGFLQQSPEAAMLPGPSVETCPPPSVQLFLLAQNLSPKGIAGNDITS